MHTAPILPLPTSPSVRAAVRARLQPMGTAATSIARGSVMGAAKAAPGSAHAAADMLQEAWRRVALAWVPGHGTALSPAGRLRALRAGQQLVLGATAAVTDALTRRDVQRAAALLLQSPRGLQQLASAADADTCALLRHAMVASLPFASRVKFLVRSLPQGILLALAEARLSQLKAINEILLAWGEHLRRMAKLDKIAQERAHLRAREEARNRLAALRQHFLALGCIVGPRAAAAQGARGIASVAINDAIGSGRGHAGELLWRSPSVPLQAALTQPWCLGVPVQGEAPRLPGMRRP